MIWIGNWLLDKAAVINASPLIILSRANHLHLLTLLAEKILVPEAVANEILQRGEKDITVQAIASMDWLEVYPTPIIPESIADWGLGAGESSVLAIALAERGMCAIIDDLLGRKCAANLKVPVRGTLGLVHFAKKRNAITSARMVMNDLINAGLYLSAEVMDDALARVAGSIEFVTGSCINLKTGAWNMPEFESCNSYSEFSRLVRYQTRFIYSEKVESFLRTVSITSESRKYILQANSPLWRAQLGHDWGTLKQEDGDEYQDKCCLPKDRMKPLPHAPNEGRANPKGIPCIYLATDKETAMSEMRPWLGSCVSVAIFSTNKKLALINCSKESKPSKNFLSEELPPEKQEEAVWGEIANAFSQPVTRDELTSHYVPTQILAELFRKNGFDGIIYKSLMGQGHNLAIFDLDAVDFRRSELHEVIKVNYEFNLYA